MNQNLTNLFAKYQTNLAFASRPRMPPYMIWV